MPAFSGAVQINQSNQPSQSNQASEPGQAAERQMRLQVVDVESGLPLPNVKVRAWVRAEPTDSSGVCVLPIPKPASENFSYRVLLTKDGYVGQYITWSKVLGDKPETMPANFTAKLEKGVSIGGIVKNDNGEPVPGAKVVLDGPPPADIGDRIRTVVAPGYHSERTGIDGKWHFDEAPRDLESMTFRVSAPEYVQAIYGCLGSVTDDNSSVLLPKADYLAGTAAMPLGHGIELSGRVLDAAGKPVADAVLTRNHEWRNPSAELMTETNGTFKISNLKPGEMYLTIQARGLAGQTRLLTLSNHMPELTVQMAPGKVLQGKVVDPSGKPIAGAAVQMDRMELGPIEFEWNAITDAQGRFSWDSAPEGEHPYCFSAAGYRPRTEPSMLANGQDAVITLHPAIDGGQVVIDGQVTDIDSKAPLTNFTVYVKEYNGAAISHSRESFTNSDGRYTVSIPATDTAYIISVGSARHKAAISGMKAVGDGDLRMNFALEGGFAMTGLLYTLDGRFVVNGYDGKVPWTNQQEMELSTVVPMPVLAATEPDAQREEFQKFLESPEGLVWQRAHHNYEVEADDTGAFKILDVPEGSYKLMVNLREPRSAGGGVIAQYSTNIDVPGAADKNSPSMDLGSLDLALKKSLKLADTAPPFEVKTVDGLPLRLADFRGKYVLLDFWATWCGPCVAETPFLKATYKAFGANPRFAMISLSVDDNPALPKDFARKNEVKWIQGFLGKWSDSNVTPLYGVEGIPSIFLIGPDGKIVARDLRGDAIRETVGKAVGAADAKD
ncbi:MAG TPA: carboxypeptidase regulatory-like domain-containing protein [Verrucomicrobiae bacterium]|jgi:thiol-disulfide isomerase/thioredoxin/protocatechuate 3,4-dioxygenase beta subunit